MNEQMTSQANNKTNASNEDEVLLVPMKGGEEVLVKAEASYLRILTLLVHQPLCNIQKLFKVPHRQGNGRKETMMILRLMMEQ